MTDDINRKLYISAFTNDVDGVRQALNDGAKVDYVDPVEGVTPLWLAVHKNHLEVARALIAAGANVNFYSQTFIKGYLPAYMIYWAKSADVLQLLLEAGADPNAAGWSRDQSAIRKYAEEPTFYKGNMVNLLAQYGAKPHAWFFFHPFSQKQADLLVDLLAQIDDIDEPVPSIRSSTDELRFVSNEGFTGLQLALTAAMQTRVDLLTDAYLNSFSGRQDTESFRSQGPLYDKMHLVRAFINNGATLDPAWIKMFCPEDQEQMLKDAAWARRKDLIILRAYLISEGSVPASVRTDKYFKTVSTTTT